MSKYKVVITPNMILPSDGVYDVTDIPRGVLPQGLLGTPHYIDHQPTKDIVEALGCIKHKGQFEGLNIGERALCFPLNNGEDVTQIDMRDIQRVG